MKSKVLFFIALLIASWAVLWQIAEFPVYFFCDEAVFAQTAYSWIQNGWRDFRGNFAPIYFEIAPGRNTPMFSSYLQAISTSLFGLSVVVSRSTNAILSLLGVFAVTFAARSFFAVRIWWLTPLVFASVPVWFLHSRTVFDNIVSVALLGCLIFFYCQYRLKSPKYIFALVLSTAGFFYTYASSQIVIPVLTVLLFISDLKYHWKQKAFVAPALLLGIILLIPAILFSLGPVDGFAGQMQALNSYLIKPISWQVKVFLFFKEFISAYNPVFWLSPTLDVLIRHRIPGIGYFPIMFTPFLLLGLIINLKQIRNPAFRCLLICFLVIPIPGALCEQSINRIMTLIVPFILWTLIGLDFSVAKLKFKKSLSLFLLVGLAANCIYMTIDAVKNGKFWYNNYGMYGLQYGTRHLFEQEIPKFIEQFPETKLLVSPNFANSPESLVPFFLTPQQAAKVSFGTVDLLHYNEIDPDRVFVMTLDEYKNVISSGKFIDPTILHSMPYPDGTVGFYFVKLHYVDNILEVYEQERIKRQQLVAVPVMINNEPAKLKHSMLDMGSAQAIFDNDKTRLARGLEANPFLLEIEFESPKQFSRLGVDFGDITSRSEITLIAQGSEEIKLNLYLNGQQKPDLQWFDLPYLKDLKTIKLSIAKVNGAETDHIHIFDIAFEHYSK